ncbi:hypothetical protein AQ490_07770 [Wenjunlia vitaminophila]|uniref:Alpha-galactosidase n=1 Tax=Wenjunlia vitaminophila TaxID=76728 RepID=A0A0T6LMP4_WENVI|nr:glycoside hydrolase family 36 protein [Wenjunlia vitaminophila]KRV47351.1 hypothetical protein AQ490_07770 [Wenjunlia vitaminophila]
MSDLTIEWGSDSLCATFLCGDHPVLLAHLSAGNGGPGMVHAQPLVEVFTAAEQRGRTSQGYVRSAVGERLRYRDHTADERTLSIRQFDVVSGLLVTSEFEIAPGTSGLRAMVTVINESEHDVVLTAMTTLTLGLGDPADLRLLWGESEWLAEGRWHEQPLRQALPDLNLALHGQDGRGRFTRTSHGSWSTGEFLPTGVLFGRSGLAWQVESSAGWHWELGQTARGCYLSLLGPTDAEHQFAQRLAPGQSFTTVPVGVAVADGGRDAALAALTDYRRTLRPPQGQLPVIYNDFMNTLMADPSTEKLLPLIGAAAEAGAEYFCVDAGWFDDSKDWWSSIGAWQEAPTRFTGGLSSVFGAIHAAGMRSGIWLEPEIVGIDSPVAGELPDEAFFRRFGTRVVEDRRYHLDLRHPAAVEHLDRTVDRLVADLGISFLKLDYNINPGVGTGEHAGAGLLGHTRALRSWLRSIQHRHPGLLVENCASGAMRMDYSLLSVTHLQSTSDQQDHLRYPPIAVSAPASVLPEQCGNWAYPSAAMTDQETVFAMVSGIMGRLYLSGFLPELRPSQRHLVHQAVEVHKRWRSRIALAHPRWPLGLPGWDDDVLALALQAPGEDALLAVWSRGAGRQVRLDGLDAREVSVVYPADADPWHAHADGSVTLDVPDGPAARVFSVRSTRKATW